MDAFLYPANFVRAVDGDTVILEIDRGFHDRSVKSFRLADLDTRELRDRDPKKREKAIEAREFVEVVLSAFTEGFRLKAAIHKTGSGHERQTFGRYVADIILDDGTILNDLLLEMGLARDWPNGKWADGLGE